MILIVAGALLGLTAPAYDGQWLIGMLLIVAGAIDTKSRSVIR